LFDLPWAVIKLWLLFPVVTQIEPTWVCLLDERNLPPAAPAPQSFFTRDLVVDVPKVLNLNEPTQVITFCEAFGLATPVLVQTALNVVGDPNIQCSTVLVCEDVHPIVVVSHGVEVIRDVSLRST
jgi:hypothetical protein